MANVEAELSYVVTVSEGASEEGQCVSIEEEIDEVMDDTVVKN